jgi:hypothetical protein
MLNKVLKEIILFIFDVGLILYFLVYYCCFNFIIEVFIGTNIAIFLFWIQKNIDIVIEGVVIFIIQKLDKNNLW